MNNKTKKRDVVLDIAKGIGIFCVVLGHCNMLAVKFVSLFHMPLFFIIAGYFTNLKNSETIVSLLKFCKKRLFLLGGTFIACNLIFLLLHNFFCDINIYTNNELFLQTAEGLKWGLIEPFSKTEIMQKSLWTVILARSEQLGGATWFLRSLLFSSVIFMVCGYLKKFIKLSDNYFYALLLLLSFCATLLLHNLNINVYSIGSTFFALFFIVIGNIINKYSLNHSSIKMLILSSLVLLLCLPLNYTHSFVNNDYSNIFEYIISGIAGYYFVYCISDYLQKKQIFAKVFSYLGQHTLIIVCLHFLAFKFVNSIQLLVYHYPNYMLAAFPVIRVHQGLWCIPYVIVGLFVPCIISYLFFYSIDFCNSRKIFTKLRCIIMRF